MLKKVVVGILLTSSLFAQEVYQTSLSTQLLMGVLV